MISQGRNGDHSPTWVEQVRVGAEIAVTVGSAVLMLLDVLDRRDQLQQTKDEGPLLPTTTSRKEEQLGRSDDPDHR
jgi:hypothetical protein